MFVHKLVEKSVSMFVRLWKSTDVGNFMQFRSVQMWGVSLIGFTTAKHLLTQKNSGEL